MAQAYEVKEVEAKRFSPLRNWYKKIIVNRLLDEGVTVEDAERAIEKLESDRPLLDWLLVGGGLQALIKMILEMILMFKSEQVIQAS
jgi:hypothetical protein